MIIKIQCPNCDHVFSIELLKLKAEMEALKARNRYLEEQVKEMNGMRALKDLFGGFK
jgi:cell division protein FtsB